MKEVKILNVTENANPKFVKTKLIEAEREGQKIAWEVVESHDSVHILVDNRETEEILLVKQVRIPVLAKNPHTDGVVYECCAGIVDKECSLAQVAKEEILEELGYDVDVETIVEIRTVMSSVGTKGTKATLFSVSVDESMKVSEGGGLPEEDIEVVRIPYDDVPHFTRGAGAYEGTSTDSTTIFLLTDWFLMNPPR